nr:single-stranded DNA-binding protein WHY2, mitochondrial-like [Coffea arabica]
MLSRLSKQLSLSASTSRNLLFQKRFSPNDGTSLWSCSFATQSGTSTARQSFVADGSMTDKIFASYSVYKGKAALSTSPMLPTFRKLDSGGVKLDRKGSIMLTFWPAVGERKYDWEKKQCFALSATEVGSMINMGPQDTREFFHDPAMLSSNAGQVRKSLSIKPHADGSGYFFSLNVVNNILKTNERLVVPVTAAEFAVMRTAFSFALPRIMGWDQYSNQPLGTAHKNPSKVLPHLTDSEWDK